MPMFLRSFLFLFLFSFIVFPGDLFEDMRNAADHRTQEFQSQGTGSLAKKVSASDVERALENVGIAHLKSTEHNFQWMIFSGGWYWRQSDEYESFYTFDQRFEDFSTLKAYFTLYVYRNSTTAFAAADIDAIVGEVRGGIFYDSLTLTTFAGHTAYKNSYIFSEGSSSLMLSSMN